MKFFSIALFVAAIFSNSLSCALCALYAPTAHVDSEFISQNSWLKQMKIRWKFSQDFTKLTLQTYDINSNSKLEDTELKEIKKALLDYLKPRGFLLNAAYYDMGGKDESLKLDLKNVDILMKNSRLEFEFVFLLDLELKDKRVIKISLFDPEDYFIFKIDSNEFQDLEDGFFIKPNANLNTAFYEITKTSPQKLSKPPLQNIVPNLSDKQKFKTSTMDEDKINFIQILSINYLQELKSLIKSGTSYTFIMLISFIYGFFHATGPGHAKLLSASYFAANGGGFLKAFLFALKVGFFHVVGALILVYVAMFLMQSLIHKTLNEATFITTKISAILIILVATFMLFSKFRKHKFKLAKTSSAIFDHPKFCSCNKCSKNKSEWLVVMASALVPCPGVVLVFILAFSVGSFLAAFLSALMIGLGMSSVIFLASIFGKALNLGFSKFKSVGFYFEILALCVMITLGVLMFIASQKVFVL